jgi:hypothetical protein
VTLAEDGFTWLSLTGDEAETQLWAQDHGIPHERVIHVPGLWTLVTALMKHTAAGLAVHRSRTFYGRSDAEVIENGLNRRRVREGLPQLGVFDPADENVATFDTCPHAAPCDCPALTRRTQRA